MGRVLVTSHQNFCFMIIAKPAQVQKGFRSFWTYTHQKRSKRNSHIQKVRWISSCTVFFVWVWLSAQGAFLSYHLRMFPTCFLVDCFCSFPSIWIDKGTMLRIRFWQRFRSCLKNPNVQAEPGPCTLTLLTAFVQTLYPLTQTQVQAICHGDEEGFQSSNLRRLRHLRGWMIIAECRMPKLKEFLPWSIPWNIYKKLYIHIKSTYSTKNLPWFF